MCSDYPLASIHRQAEGNIDAICKDGLNPQLRRGQAYGKGEYFAVRGTSALPLPTVNCMDVI